MTTTIAGRQFAVTRDDVEQAVLTLEPEPVDVWFVVVGRRRYPPKQVVEAVTGLDRADFNSHQARSLLSRLGFVVERRLPSSPQRPSPRKEIERRIAAEAAALEPYAGRWVAQSGSEILFDADSVEAVVQWIYRHKRRATVWRIPTSPSQLGSALSQPL